MNNRGFTLIEILIALVIFAILATITSSTLYNAFNTRTRVNEQSQRLESLQLTISFLKQDITQIVERATRSSKMSLIPMFIGRSNYLEFTRDGAVNPQGIEQRSTLKRVAYLCQNNTLKRRTWDSLDSVNRNKYSDKTLIDKLMDCHFGYLNQILELFPEWYQEALNQKPLPKAVQINLNLAGQGEINLLFIIPGALYASNE
jgi:general secretion pathway protein J